MTPLDESLTRRQGVVISGRLLCVLFLYWSLCNLSEIPSLAIAMLHYLRHGEGAASVSFYSYWARHYVFSICWAVVRAVVELWVAGMFYRCGPKISGFLLPPEVEMEASRMGEV